MSYEVLATFSGGAQQQNRFSKFIKGALSNEATANTLYESFKITVTGVKDAVFGIEVTFVSENNGKAFCAWACKECDLSVECAGYDDKGTISYTFPETVMNATPQQKAAVQEMQLANERAREVQQTSAASSAAQAVADVALQSMLKAAREEGIAEGRFQILKNIMQSCDTLNEMLALTGVQQEEFVALVNRFSKKG